MKTVPTVVFPNTNPDSTWYFENAYMYVDVYVCTFFETFLKPFCWAHRTFFIF